MGRKVFVIGVGMTKFEKPGAKDWDYPDMAQGGGREGARRTRASRTTAIEQAAVGYCYGDSTCGQRAVYAARPDRHPGLQRQQQLLDRARPRCSWRSSSSRAASPSACSRSASRRWRRARSARSTPTAPTRWTSSSRLMIDAARLRAPRPPRRRSSATPAASTWSSTARSASSSPRSARRTTSTR